jgi:predicted DNA-binding antitoxin AbrB/MazE fold protein
MTQLLPAIYAEGVFKPLKKIDLPPEPQTYLLFVVSGKDIEELAPAISRPTISAEQRIADLISELKADLSNASNLDFQFDEEHQRMFEENARGLAPFIPSMIPEEITTSGNNDDEKVSL